MEKNTVSYFMWLVVLVAVVIFLSWVFGLRSASQEVLGNQTQSNVPAPLVNASETTSTSSAAVSDEQVIANSAAHYRFTVPASWYIEKNGAMSLAVYPDYDPKSGTQPSCKIEISALENKSNTALPGWLTEHLHQDPTTEIMQTSQSISRISDHDAITWTGALNGASTTLVYVSGAELVYEFAPSRITKTDCQAALKLVLKNFTITP